MNAKKFERVRQDMIWINNWYGLGVIVVPARDAGEAGAGAPPNTWLAFCCKKATQRFPYSVKFLPVVHISRDAAVREAINRSIEMANPNVMGSLYKDELKQYLLEVQQMIGKA